MCRNAHDVTSRRQTARYKCPAARGRWPLDVGERKRYLVPLARGSRLFAFTRSRRSPELEVPGTFSALGAGKYQVPFLWSLFRNAAAEPRPSPIRRQFQPVAPAPRFSSLPPRELLEL